MNDIFEARPPEFLDFNIDLDNTARPGSHPSDVRWDGDSLDFVGAAKCNCSSFKSLEPEITRSLRDHIIKYIGERKYTFMTAIGGVRALGRSINRHPTRTFDKAWLLAALEQRSFRSEKGWMKSFFKYWNDRYPNAICHDALQLLAKPLRRPKRARNVLSDDPEKSWLTNMEYDALLQHVWENYDRGITGTQTTLLRLLSMQYARRPVQFAQLKIGDFIEGSSNEGSVSGRRIHFPGAKDSKAEDNFRDSKEEIHPVADHLWDLFQIQKHEIKESFELTLEVTINEPELKKLPVFTSKAQLEMAVDELTNHYGVNWRENLDSRLFHLNSATLSKYLSWRRNVSRDACPQEQRGKMRPTTPLSHRTGRPIVASHNRMRHTRARQLARLGMPKHFLSFWLGHTDEESLDSYYNDPAEEARKISEAMNGALVPLAMSFTGKLLDDESQASRANDPESKLEFAKDGKLKNVGSCGKHSFCSTMTVPIPCYRCKHFEPLVDAPHDEVLDALLKRQADENATIRIGGSRKLVLPIDLSQDIRAVKACIARCDARKAELEVTDD